jgi:hypothetical protein
MNHGRQSPVPRAGSGGDAKRVVKLLYQSYLPHQGRYPRVSDQAQILGNAGFEVTVLACDRECRHPREETLEGVRVERIPVRTRENLGPLLQWLQLLIY